MKNKNLDYFQGFMVILFILIFSTSCATRVKFPVSSELPAAEVKAKIKEEENSIYEIKVDADYMADPSRLNPPKNTYVVWVMAADGANYNIGQLDPGNSKSAMLKTVSPNKPVQLFITAEENSDPEWPSTQVVFRSESVDID